MKLLSRVRLFATPWTVAHQAPKSMEFSRQKYWSGLPFPSPGDLPNPGIEPGFPALQADALPSKPRGPVLSLKPWLRLRPLPEGAKGKARFLPQLISNFLPYLVPALPIPPQAVSSLRAELGWGHIYLGTEHSVNLNTEWKTDSDIGV